MWKKGCFAILLACLSSMAMAKADLRLHGSNTVGAELAPSLVKAWMASEGYEQIEEQAGGSPFERTIIAKNKDGKSISVELASYGSSTAFKDMDAGTADIGMSSRPVKETEVKKLVRFGELDEAESEYVIGLDGIAVVVNNANPLQQLSKAAIRDIFSGKVTNWAEVGGKAGPIAIYSLDDNSGTYDTFKSLVLGTDSLSTKATRFVANEAVEGKVAADVNAIGFVGLPYVKATRALAVSDGETRPIAPDSFSVATEDYVLARRLYFYAPAVERSPLMDKLLGYAVSPAGQAIVEKVGFVPQKVLAGTVTLDDGMPAEYRQFADGAKRLSVNFRFYEGGAKLDSKAHRDIERLKSFFNQQEQNKYLMLFGFADSQEMPISALEISNDRADLVADLLMKEGLKPFRVRGFGNAVPVASNETEEGRFKNRRVEVWVK